MDGVTLYGELTEKQRYLDMAASEIKTRGIALAEAERAYRCAKAKKILDLREQGTPATITLDLTMGDEEVSLLRLKRDSAEVLYRSALEFLQLNKLEYRVLANQISAEMGNTNMC